MKIQLTGLDRLEIIHDTVKPHIIPSGWINMRVTHCAICKTDVRMWSHGHRDLIIPRVPGHEIVAIHNKKRFVVWPGIVCNECQYCTSGNENLCDSMKILGFHSDGGYSDMILAPQKSCIPIPDKLDSITATFAEPAGCIVNAFRKINLKKNDRLLIFGAGTMGLLAGLLSLQYEAYPVIIEKNKNAILKAATFVNATGIVITEETQECQFNVILDACSDPHALMSAISRSAKGGSIVFFSGLDKNIQIDTKQLSTIHYKELRLLGSYGLTKNDMRCGLDLISRVPDAVKLLVEKVISPESIEKTFRKILNGTSYKFILDFENHAS